MVRRKLTKKYEALCLETGVVVVGRKAKWRIKDECARCATWDGKLRFSKIIITEVK